MVAGETTETTNFAWTSHFQKKKAIFSQTEKHFVFGKNLIKMPKMILW